MNDKLDQLGDAIAVLQRQIATRFGKENQSSPLSFTPAKLYVATSVGAPLLNSLSTPVPEFDHYHTRFEPLEQKPKATSILMLDYEDEDGFADVQNNSKLCLTPSCKDLVKHPNSDLKVACLTEIVGTELGFGVEENELDDALIKRWIGSELGHVAGIDYSEDVVVIKEHNVFDKIPQSEIGIYSREGAGGLITPRPLPKPPPPQWHLKIARKALSMPSSSIQLLHFDRHLLYEVTVDAKEYEKAFTVENSIADLAKENYKSQKISTVEARISQLRSLMGNMANKEQKYRFLPIIRAMELRLFHTQRLNEINIDRERSHVIVSRSEQKAHDSHCQPYPHRCNYLETAMEIVSKVTTALSSLNLEVSSFKRGLHQFHNPFLINVPKKHISLTCSAKFIGVENSHEPTKLLVLLNNTKEESWEFLQESITCFPRKKVGNVASDEFLVLEKEILKWPLLACSAFSRLTYFLYFLHRNRELVIYLGFYSGIMTTNFFDKICRDLMLDHPITWRLLRRASFFLLVNVTSPYFFRVNDFLIHIANDGLMQVLWSWKEITKLDREKTSSDGILELQYLDDWILASRKSLMLVDELKLIVEYNAICGFLDKRGKDNLMLDNSYEAFGKHARAICLLWYHQAHLNKWFAEQSFQREIHGFSILKMNDSWGQTSMFTAALKSYGGVV